MGRTILVPDGWLGLFLYGFHIVVLAVVALFVVFQLDGATRFALAALLVGFAAAMVVGLWRRRTDRDAEHLGTVGDLAYDPIAHPGQAAKHRWQKALDRLPGGDDDGD